MDLGLRGRRALVTGSHRGTGLAIARALVDEGAWVALHGNQEGPQTALAEELRQGGARVTAVTGDLATDEGADAVQAAVHDAFGALDILVNNYGVPAGGGWGTAAPADWVAIYQQNTLSAVRMIERCVPGMKERGFGRIVQIATIGAARPARRMPHYYASKAALVNLTVSLAKELAGAGVTVNCVSPGLIRTPEVEQLFTHRAKKKGWGDDWEEIERRGVEEMMPNPLRRMARPEEVASAVAFLVSERAGYLNGVNLRIDGGATETVQL